MNKKEMIEAIKLKDDLINIIIMKKKKGLDITKEEIALKNALIKVYGVRCQN